MIVEIFIICLDSNRIRKIINNFELLISVSIIEIFIDFPSKDGKTLMMSFPQFTSEEPIMVVEDMRVHRKKNKAYWRMVAENAALDDSNCK